MAKPDGNSTMETQKTKTNQKVKSKETETKSIIHPLLLVISISALALSATSLWQINNSKGTQNNQLSELKTNINDQLQQLKQNLSEDKDKLAENIDAITKEQSQDKKQYQLLKASIIALSKEKSHSDKYWQFKKAAYLLDIAGLSIYWEKKPEPAITLLNSADNILKSLKDPSLIALRQTINNEVTSLKSVPEVDTTGLLSKLNSLNQEIGEIPLNHERFSLKDSANEADKAEKSSNDNKEATAEPTKWQKALDTAKHTLSKLVVIRYRKQPIEPIFSLKERQAIIEQIKLALSQAEWAIIRQDTYLYQFSLNDATSLIKKNFDSENKATINVLNILKELKAHNIAPKLPDISRSRRLLQAFIDSAPKGSDA